MSCGAALPLNDREKFIIIGSAALTVLLAWTAMVSVHGGEHAAHGAAGVLSVAGPGSHPSSFAFLFPMWTVMMVAMMLPPVLPWIWFYAAATRAEGEGPVGWGRVAVFSSGYFAVWTGFSLVAAAAQVWLHGLGLITGAEQRLPQGLLAGAVLLSAGFYQLSPLKGACLRHCRSPLTYFMQRWIDGPAGAFSMGARHGFYCLACCWALMLVSFSVGVMNFAWMAALTVFLTVEKTAPGGETAGRIFGILMAGWGAYYILF